MEVFPTPGAPITAMLSVSTIPGKQAPWTEERTRERTAHKTAYFYSLK